MKVRHFGFTNLWGVAFSPNGRFLVLAGEGDSVWLMRRFGEAGLDNEYDIQLLETPAPVRSVVFGSKYLAAASDDGVVRVYDPESAALKQTLKSDEGHVIRLALNNDENLLAGASSDGLIRVWEPGSGRLITKLKFHTSVITGVAFNPNQPELASADYNGNVEVWKTTELGHRVDIARTHVPTSGLQYSPDGRFLAVGGPYLASFPKESIRLWKRREDNSGAWDPIAQAGTRASIVGLGFSGTPPKMTLGLENGMELWNFPELAVTKSIPISSRITSLDVSSGGTRIATVHRDATYRLWHANLREILSLKLDEILPLGETGQALRSIIPIGNLAKGIVGSWDASTGRWARLRLVGTRVERIEISGPLQSIVTPYTSSGPLAAINPLVAVGSRVPTNIAGGVVRRLASTWREALDTARAAPPPALTDLQCRQLLGVAACPPLPMP